MAGLAAAVSASWSVDPGFVFALLAAAGLYVRGFRSLHVQMPERFPRWRRSAFFCGLAVLFVAIASPLDAFAFLLLSVHMLQHVLLIAVAPPLLLLGAPALPLLRGLPAAWAKAGAGPFLAWPALRHFGAALSHPVIGFAAVAVVTWGWHVPAAYELALRVPAWHAVEHASFVAAGLLFWWPVVQPWPSRPRGSRWAIVPFLLLADLQNTALAAILVFSDRVLYPSYARAPRLGELSAHADQTLAGLLMWVPMSLVYLVPAAVITLRLLSPQRAAVPVARTPAAHAHAPSQRFDLLAVPWLGALLRSQRARRALQLVTFGIAIAVVIDGFAGPEVAPMNLAGVVPWTYWRGGVIVGLLVLGNAFCAVCPFLLPRDVARRVRAPRLQWPAALRSKWMPVALLATFLWAAEVFALWADPAATAWLVIAYFAGALIVDSLFQGASFCKYVCPVGHFQFAQSLVSPFEVAVRRPATCGACATRDCVEGNARARGCELELFVPRKAGNLDCTLCLDCVRACPHDNIGLLATAPGRTLVRDPDRASLGRLSRRPDFAVLALVVVFGALVNSAAMVGPVVTAQLDWTARLGLASPRPVAAAAFAVALGVAPLLLAFGAAGLGRRIARSNVPLRELLGRFAPALLPLGLAMWTAHFSLHGIAGWRSVAPVLQRCAPGLLGRPNWELCLPGIAAETWIGFEILLLDAGLLLTLWLVLRIARDVARPAGGALALALPWAVMAVALWCTGVWIVFQPMEMRGLMSAG